MNLLLVTQDFPPEIGGIETYCFELARHFDNSVDRFAVVAPTNKASNSVDKNLTYPVYRIPTAENSLLPLFAPVPVACLAQKGPFDVVFHAQWQTVISSLLSKKLGYPKRTYVAVHARELLLEPFAGNGGWISRKLYARRKKMFSKVDGFFPVSNFTSSLLKREGVPEHKIHVVSNGANPDFFRPRDTAELREKLGLQNKKVILTICRLVPRKGIDLVLQAMRELVKLREDVVYLIGGTGNDNQRLRSLISDFQLDEYVRFLGWIPDERMPLYYSLADVFVMPAKNEPPDVEGFGIVFLEANACGTPVIGARTGGIPDAIADGETGFLIDEGNSKQLFKALLKIFQDEKLAKEMGENGRNRVLQEATWNHVAEKLIRKMKLINRQKIRY